MSLTSALSVDTVPHTDKEIRCISTGLWAPFNLLQRGRLTGIGIDYWHLVAKKAGIKTHCYQADQWSEVLASIKEGRADMTVATEVTPERLKYARFSKPYASYPLVIATKNRVGFIHDIGLIHGRKIALPRSYATTHMVLERYGDLNVIMTDSIEDALKAVEKGEAFATIGVLPVISYKINKEGFDTLKISGTLPLQFSVRFMLAKSVASLLPQINQAIDRIRQSERDAINRKWITIGEREMVNRRYFDILLLAGIATGVLLGFLLYRSRKEIRRKERIEEELRSKANHDMLTQIYNRRMLDQALSQAIDRSEGTDEKLFLIYFDIDCFKLINDRYGHPFGDTVLKTIAQVVRRHIRKEDIFGRWGGDEFLLIIFAPTLFDAHKLVEHLDREIRLRRFEEDTSVSCSFGVIEYRKGESKSQLFARVDQAMYHAKKTHRKCDKKVS